MAMISLRSGTKRKVARGLDNNLACGMLSI